MDQTQFANASDGFETSSLNEDNSSSDYSPDPGVNSSPDDQISTNTSSSDDIKPLPPPPNEPGLEPDHIGQALVGLLVAAGEGHLLAAAIGEGILVAGETAVHSGAVDTALEKIGEAKLAEAKAYNAMADALLGTGDFNLADAALNAAAGASSAANPPNSNNATPASAVAGTATEDGREPNASYAEDPSGSSTDGEPNASYAEDPSGSSTDGEPNASYAEDPSGSSTGSEPNASYGEDPSGSSTGSEPNASYGEDPSGSSTGSEPNASYAEDFR